MVLGTNLTRGMTTSCGCRRRNDLTGRRMGHVTVLGLFKRRGSRGGRKVQLWQCRCDCGAVTYKATDILTYGDVSMCWKCAKSRNISKAREKAGFVDGTQLTRIQSIESSSSNASGVRGVYLNPRTGKYRARIKFQGKQHNLGIFSTLEDAVRARKIAEEEIFGSFLSDHQEMVFRTKSMKNPL